MSDDFNILNPDADAEGAAGFDALRERAASALEAAYGFVEREGHGFSKLRARILVQLEPVERGIEALEERVGEAGGVEPIGQVLAYPLESRVVVAAGSGAANDFVGRLEVLSAAADWGRLYEPVVDRVVAGLFRSATGDGGHGPAVDATREPIDRVISTALTAGFLGRTRSARPEMLRGAGAYLAPHWSVEALRQHGWPCVAAFSHYYTNVYDEERESALPWCGRELERGFLAHEYTADQVMRVLFYCEVSALPGVTFDANALLVRLFDDQNTDGSVGDATLPAGDRVATTIDAMHFILRVCNSPGQ